MVFLVFQCKCDCVVNPEVYGVTELFLYVHALLCIEMRKALCSLFGGRAGLGSSTHLFHLVLQSRVPSTTRRARKFYTVVFTDPSNPCTYSLLPPSASFLEGLQCSHGVAVQFHGGVVHEIFWGTIKGLPFKVHDLHFLL